MLATHTAGCTALADWPRGDLLEAAQLLSSCIDRRRSAGRLHLATSAACTLGEVQLAQGDPDTPRHLPVGA